jgi:hypothetical protein
MAYTQGNNPISRKTSPVLQNFAADGGIPVEKETKKHSLETAEDAPVYKGLVAVKGQPPLQGPPPPPKKDKTFLPPSATAKPPEKTYSNEGDPTIYNKDGTQSSFKSGAAKQGPNGQYSIQSTTTY